MSLSLTGEQGSHTLFTRRERKTERVREKERERGREGGRERERERGRERERVRKRERERCPEFLFLFLKGITGALAPFSYLVHTYESINGIYRYI
jgi:hypothetical protein